MGLVVHVVGRQGCKATLSLLQFHLKHPTLAVHTERRLGQQTYLVSIHRANSVLSSTNACNMQIQVIREGGINPVVNNDRSEAQSAASDAQSANDHAVSDAMECLVHIARASNEGTAVTLQSRGLSAAAQALHVSSCLCLTGPSCWVYAADLRLVGRPHAIAFCSMACCVGGSSHACLLMTYAQHDCGDIYAFGHQVRMLV